MLDTYEPSRRDRAVVAMVAKFVQLFKPSDGATELVDVLVSTKHLMNVVDLIGAPGHTLIGRY